MPEGFQLGISFVVAAVVGQFERPFPNAGECRKGFDADADVPDAAQRIEPCPVFAGIGGFGLPPIALYRAYQFRYSSVVIPAVSICRKSVSAWSVSPRPIRTSVSASAAIRSKLCDSLLRANA